LTASSARVSASRIVYWENALTWGSRHPLARDMGEFDNIIPGAFEANCCGVFKKEISYVTEEKQIRRTRISRRTKQRQKAAYQKKLHGDDGCDGDDWAGRQRGR